MESARLAPEIFGCDASGAGVQASKASKAAAGLPMVSLITTTFNAASTVGACLESVCLQDYPNFEHVIIDGASTDETMSIVRGFKSARLRWISEPDDGIFDAWNKGLLLAHGEWIAFVGADDVLLPGAVSAYMQLAAAEPDALYLSSKVRWVSPSGRSRVIGHAWSWPRFQRYMCTAHVGSMHHRRLFERYGRYDNSLRIVADYELLLRAGEGLKAAFLPCVTVRMQGGGNSDNLAALEESALVKVKTGKRSPSLAAIERMVGRQGLRARRLLDRWL